jgi:hypothetical protein
MYRIISPSLIWGGVYKAYHYCAAYPLKIQGFIAANIKEIYIFLEFIENFFIYFFISYVLFRFVGFLLKKRYKISKELFGKYDPFNLKKELLISITYLIFISYFFWEISNMPFELVYKNFIFMVDYSFCCLLSILLEVYLVQLIFERIFKGLYFFLRNIRNFFCLFIFNYLIFLFLRSILIFWLGFFNPYIPVLGIGLEILNSTLMKIMLPLLSDIINNFFNLFLKLYLLILDIYLIDNLLDLYLLFVDIYLNYISSLIPEPPVLNMAPKKRKMPEVDLREASKKPKVTPSTHEVDTLKSLAEHLSKDSCDNNFINTLGEAKNVFVKYTTSLTIKYLLGDPEPRYFYLLEDDYINDGKFYVVKSKNLKYFPADLLNAKPSNIITYMRHDISITKDKDHYTSLMRNYELPEGVGIFEAFIETEKDLFIALQNKVNVPTSEDYRNYDNFVYIKSNGSNEWVSYYPDTPYNPGCLGLRLNGKIYPTNIWAGGNKGEEVLADSPVAVLQRIRPLQWNINFND